MICTCHGLHVEFKRQFMQVSSLVLPHGSRWVNSGHQAWWHVPLSTEPSHLCVSNPPPFVVIETGLPCVAQVSLRQSMYIAHPPALAFQMLRLKACATIPGPFLCFFIWNKVSLSCLGEPWTPSVARQFLHFLFPLLQSYEWLGYHTCATRPS